MQERKNKRNEQNRYIESSGNEQSIDED